MPDKRKDQPSGDHLWLVDGSGYIFRAYHALPPLTRKSDALPVGAISGFCNMLFKFLQADDADPPMTHLGVIFDASGKTFRNKIYPEYKANRPPPPDDLIPQFPLVREATRAFGVATAECEGFEADDLIAAYARQAAEAGIRVTIVSADKDLMQLVRPGVSMLDPVKGKHIGNAEVMEKFGVPPGKVVDVQALAGDSTDNVPGIPGIGVKTAAQLINEYGDLDTLLAAAKEIKQQKRRENLIEYAELARVSRDLVRLKDTAPMPVSLADMAVRPMQPEQAIGFLKDMEFQTLTRRVAGVLGVDESTIASGGAHGAALAAAPAASTAAPAATSTADLKNFSGAVRESVTTLAGLKSWITAAQSCGYVVVDVETDSLDAMQARLVGVALCTEPGRACYVPLLHGGDGLDLDSTAVGPQIPQAEALKALKPMLEDPGILKIGQNIKYDALVFLNHGIRITPVDDTMTISYALDAGRHGHGMDELSREHLNHAPIPFKDVAGSGKKQITFDRVPVDQAVAYAAEDADVTLRLWETLKPRLVEQKMCALYETLERPLIPVLVEMERTGIKVDRTVLARLSDEFAGKMAAMEKDIHKLAGESFNIASPKQLGEILFDKMSLSGGQKTRTGAWSTDADALERLAAEGHDLPRRVLNWRQLAKLKSTYTDALPGFIHPKTGRVHTSYSMASTSTGRLASSDPNLQNIPIRTDDGRRIRSAFIAEKGHILVSADYSQIELRILAHVADIAALKQAFADGIDIHALTASEMFSAPVEGMDPAMRRRAKAINFGIIYGISAFGLANQLDISRGEAGKYIESYFKKFPGIRDYMERTKAQCREQGYVSTLFGRKVHFPGIDSKNPAMRGFMERAAINAPIQGTAADVIRRAMIRMPSALEEIPGARMLLQVHDELIFEVPKAGADAVCATARRVMESAAEPACSLDVPLEIDARAAATWEEAH